MPLLGDLVVADVAVVAADALVAAGAERQSPWPVRMMTPTSSSSRAALKRVLQLEERLRAERVAHLGPVDGDLRDARVVAGRDLVADVAVLAAALPRRARRDARVAGVGVRRRALGDDGRERVAGAGVHRCPSRRGASVPPSLA